ncbi:formimidoylglutamase [Aquimarina sp. ERC-38]|uniref:formimidoylglutamase n=1 Tax=Aquimarina sp. ERC-38 TaxID=2949996 RepID=UPI002245EEED|nr:formimidoylglutamase [Aquimarina sp. ERC-38]UZO81418.1 formimidoylglutamase [Aquimarina sp. ERC-38]
MPFEFLEPVSSNLIADLMKFDKKSVGRNIYIHTDEWTVPDLKDIDIAIIVINETRGSILDNPVLLDFNEIRRNLYKLFPGNWGVSIADLGTIHPGNTLQDTYYLVQEITQDLLKADVIPILLGGSQDLAYYQYRAYDVLERMVNMVNVDATFDLGNVATTLTNQSYVGKIIVDQPYNLFNYSNIGYQTYFNSQEHIDLIEKLYFDAYRLGDVITDITIVEPIMRDADLVSIDLKALQNSFVSPEVISPNGFNHREICAISRYAGISDKVKSLSIFECFQENKHQYLLIAQMIWYFIEGLNYRTNELNIKSKKETLHYQVPVEDEILSFYQSSITKRWWIEIPFLPSGNNKLERHTLLPCTYNDYKRACNQEIPERWYKAKRKNEV